MKTTTTVPAATTTADANPNVFRLTVCERCGTFAAPDTTHCPVCTRNCGGPCCTGTGAAVVLGGAR